MAGACPPSRVIHGWQMSDQTGIVVVDDQAVIRAGLCMILDNEPDMAVIGEAANGIEAVEVVAATGPEVVLMDIRMAELDGIEATRQIVTQEDPPAVLVLTTFEDDEYVFESLRAGASGFLLKDAEPDLLLSAIRSVAAGDTLVDPAVTRSLVDRWAQLENDEISPRLTPDLLELTERENDVLVLLANGQSNREIADSLYLSEATIKTHVSNLLSKLGVHSRVQAVIVAYEYGVVKVGDSNPLRPSLSRLTRPRRVVFALRPWRTHQRPPRRPVGRTATDRHRVSPLHPERRCRIRPQPGEPDAPRQ